MSVSAVKAQTVIKNLTKKGFKEGRKGDHIRLHYYDTEGRMTNVHTKISRGSNIDIGSNLLSIMGQQMGLSLNDFIRFSKCDMDQKEYEETAKNFISGTHFNP